MNIYFACSLTGGRDNEALYGALVDHLIALEHEVPTAHLASPEVMDLEKIEAPGEIFKRDVAWIQACDALVAEVSTPSHGVGYEIAYALSLKKPVLCLYHQEVVVSKMITGNDMPGIYVRSYGDKAEALARLESFLDRVKLA
ncbi:MAG: hypothetical protein GTO14_00735 [Anaerolineales bacterium]|nr:hypothetical protein [Anaerolineales bacterium]